MTSTYRPGCLTLVDMPRPATGLGTHEATGKRTRRSLTRSKRPVRRRSGEKRTALCGRRTFGSVNMRKGVWMRICDSEGLEQSSVMVLGDFTFWMHSFEDGKPMLIDYEYELGSGTANAEDVCELARKLGTPDPRVNFAAGGTQLLKAAV